MMSFGTLLKLQAYLDGELSSRQAAKMARFVANNAEAQLWLEELRAVKTLLAGNEPKMAVSESREFYWSRIARAIESQAAPAQREVRHGAIRWLGWLLPAGAAAALVLMLAGSPRFGALHLARTGTSTEAPEIESPLDDVTVMSFHSSTEGMTVVWINSY
jgi:anti-sigma factor RsiW